MPHAGVGHREPDEGAGEPVRIGDRVELDLLGREGQRAAVRHGVARVDRQVEHGRVPARPGRPRSAAARPACRPRCVMSPRSVRASSSAAPSPQPGAEVDRLGVQRLPPRDGQQPLGQLAAALGGAAHALDHLRPAVRLRHPVHQREAAQHDLQQVVEVVGHAAGQLADRLELLGRHAGAPRAGCARSRRAPRRAAA